MSKVANMVLNGELSAKDANAISYSANVILGAIRVDEQQARIDELEKIVETMKAEY